MNETTFKDILDEELPLVHKALLRRFPESPLRRSDLEDAALHAGSKCWSRGEPLPISREELFAWLFGLAFRRHILTLIVRVRETVRERLVAQCRKLGVDLDEVLQDAWLRAQKAIESRGEDGSFPLTEDHARNWFWRVAHNTAHDHRRALNRHATSELSPQQPAVEATQTDDLDVQALARCLECLPEMERQTVELSMEGLKSAVIADRLDIPVEQVYYLMRRAKLHLRLCLSEEPSEVSLP
jgi:RNA polymerase sigma factor (sigma-70 family)